MPLFVKKIETLINKTMSTEIGKVKGRFEEKHNGDMTVDYGKSKMYVGRFYGGTENGPMVQLTLDMGKDYIQLTKKEAKKLRKLLKKTFKF